MTGKMTKNADGVVVLIHECEICGKVAPFGFNNFWACRDHRREVESMSGIDAA